MMLEWFINGRGLKRFFRPDGGESGSGGDSKSGGKPAVDVEKLFADIPLDELDDKTKQLLLDVKKQIGSGFATLQTQVGELENIKKQARDFQSQKDKLQQQLDLITGKKPNPEDDDYLKAAENVLRSQGYTPEQIKQHAPVFAGMLKEHTNIFKKELGRDLGPMAGQVALSAAREAFEEAQQSDDVGILQIPEVAEKVWQATQNQIKTGGPVNSAFVTNLAKIEFINHAKQLKADGKELPELFKGNGAASVNTGGFTFPGAGRVSAGSRAIAEPQKSGNEPKTTLNSDTEAALAATFKTLGRDTNVYPEKFKPATK